MFDRLWSHLPLSPSGLRTLLPTLSILCYATYPLIAKQLTSNSSPVTIVFITSAITLFLLLFLFGGINEYRKHIRLYKLHKLHYSLLIGLLKGAMGPLLYILGLSLSPVFNAIIINALGVPLHAIGAHFLLKEKMSRNYVLGFSILIFGLYAFITDWFRVSYVPSTGDTLLFLSIICFVAGNIIHEKFLSHVPSELMIIERTAVGMLITLAIMSLQSASLPIAQITIDNLVWFVAMAIIPISLAQTLWYISVRITKVSHLILIASLEPLFSATLAWLVLHDPLSMSKSMAGVIMLTGIILSHIHIARHRKIEHNQLHLRHYRHAG